MSTQATREILPNGLSVLITSTTRTPKQHHSTTANTPGRKRVLLTIFVPGYACRASDFDLVVQWTLHYHARDRDDTGVENETATERVYVSIDFPGTRETDVRVLSSLDLDDGGVEGDGRGERADVKDDPIRGKRKPTIESYARCLNYARNIMEERLLAKQDRHDSTTSEPLAGAERIVDGETVVETVLVGHSMGVRVVLEAFTQRQQGVVGLVFLDGSWYNLRGKGYVKEQLRIFREEGDHTQRESSEGGGEKEEGASKEREQAVERLFAQMWSEHTPIEFRERALQDAKHNADRLASLRMSHLLWDNENLEHALRVVNDKAIKVLVIQSTDAKGLARIPMKTGDESRWMKLVRDSVADGCYRGEVLEGLGHFPHIDGSERVAEVLRKWEEQTLR